MENSIVWSPDRVPHVRTKFPKGTILVSGRLTAKGTTSYGLHPMEYFERWSEKPGWAILYQSEYCPAQVMVWQLTYVIVGERKIHAEEFRFLGPKQNTWDLWPEEFKKHSRWPACVGKIRDCNDVIDLLIKKIYKEEVDHLIDGLKQDRPKRILNVAETKEKIVCDFDEEEFCSSESLQTRSWESLDEDLSFGEYPITKRGVKNFFFAGYNPNFYIAIEDAVWGQKTKAAKAKAKA